MKSRDVTFNPPEWDGERKRMAELWRMRKGDRVATAVMWNHPIGAEVRIEVDAELRGSHASRDLVVLLVYTDEWRLKFEGKGWSETPPLDVPMPEDLN